MSASTSWPLALFIDSEYRFMRILVIAFTLHALIIGGIGFQSNINNSITSNKMLDVRLQPIISKEAPEDAEFIAAHHRIGSGEHEQSESKQAPKSAANPVSNTVSAQKQSLNQQSTRVISSEKSTQTVKKEEDRKEIPDLLNQSLKQVAMQNRADYLAETYKRNSRVKRVNASSAKGKVYAYYLKLWQRSMEQYGTQRYPEAARGCTKDKCYVRLLVAINSDGTLRELKILQSSGRRELDNFAVETVQRTMPFAPFSKKMKAELDVLEVVRRFEFQWSTNQ